MISSQSKNHKRIRKHLHLVILISVFIFRLSSKTFRINERILSPMKIKNIKVAANKQSTENSKKLNLINMQLTKIDEPLNIDIFESIK